MKNYELMVKYWREDWKDAELAGTLSVVGNETDTSIEKKVKECLRKYIEEEVCGVYEMIGVLRKVIRDHNLEEAVNEETYESLFKGTYEYKMVETE